MRLPLLLLAVAAAVPSVVALAFPSSADTDPGSITDLHDKTGLSNMTTVRQGWSNPPACSDDEWERYKCRGQKLLDMMIADDETAGSMFDPPQPSAQSKFNTFARDFLTWGYKTYIEPYCDMDNRQFGIAEALRGIHVSPSEGWMCHTMYHGDPFSTTIIANQTYWVDGKEYRATRAKHASAFNPGRGVLMMTSRFSPQNEGPKLTPPVTDGFPELDRSSDIVFGQWKEATVVSGVEVDQLRHIFEWSITNRYTPSIISKAFELYGINNGLTKYPGVTFSMGTDAFKALLGSPNGAAVGYLIAQHKEQLGPKVLTHVTIFGHTSDIFPMQPVLVWQVERITNELADQAKGSDLKTSA